MTDRLTVREYQATARRAQRYEAMMRSIAGIRQTLNSHIALAQDMGDEIDDAVEAVNQLMAAGNAVDQAIAKLALKPTTPSEPEPVQPPEPLA